ncbi:MAG: hypothetical protein HYY06_20350 [Deltaproteobacteria bacterium]|nr:hypothetical protein [Deltaproteobacteria bacterium]
MSSTTGAKESAARAVRAPAIGVVVTGALWLLLWIGGALYSLVQMAGGPLEPGATPPALNLVAQIVFAAVAVLVIVGGLQMRRLRHRGLAMTAAILSLVCGCLPLAIWAIVVLCRPDVVQAFAEEARRAAAW